MKNPFRRLFAPLREKRRIRRRVKMYGTISKQRRRPRPKRR